MGRWVGGAVWRYAVHVRLTIPNLSLPWYNIIFCKAASPFFGKLRVGYVELLHTLTQRCALRFVACSAAGRSSRIFIQRIRGLVLACTYTPAVECLTENYMRTAQQR